MLSEIIRSNYQKFLCHHSLSTTSFLNVLCFSRALIKTILLYTLTVYNEEGGIWRYGTFFLFTIDGSRLKLGSTELYVLVLEPTSIATKLIRLNNSK